MRKIYSLALMAVMLLVSANGWAETQTVVKVSTEAELETAIANAATDGTQTKILLTKDIPITDNLVDRYATPDERFTSANKFYISKGKNIEIDLNGNTLTFDGTGDATKSNYIVVEGAKLSIISGEKDGAIHLKPTEKYTDRIIQMMGTTQPDTDQDYSYLSIGKNVTLTIEQSNNNIPNIGAIMVHQKGTVPEIQENGESKMVGASFGVHVVIDGAKIETGSFPLYVSGNIKAKQGNIPLFEVKGGASLSSTDTNSPSETEAGQPNRHAFVHNQVKDSTEGSAVIYAAGVAQWNLYNSTIMGPNGIYLKAGGLLLDGTQIHATGDYASPIFHDNGFAANGVGLVYDSNGGYGYIIGLNIAGNTEIKSDNAYAIVETITSGDESKPNKFVISGGSFIGGGDYPAIKTTTQLQQKLNDAIGDYGITGGLFYNQDNLIDYVSKNGGTVTPIKDENGNTVYAVTKQEGETKNFAEASATDNANLDANATIKNGEVKEVKNLYVKGTSVLTIEKGGKLIVNGTLTIEANANVTVEAGGVIVIKGGVNSVNTKNFVLKATATDQAILLYSPEITGWSNPKGIVELYTNVGKNAQGERLWQRFGLGLKTLSSASRTPAVAPTIVEWNYTNDSWMTVADVKTMKPFVGYAVSHNEEQKEVIFSFNGSLYGHESEDFTLVTNGWNYFANSYMGKASASVLLSDILGVNGVEATIQIWDPAQQNFQPVTAVSLGKQDAGKEIYPLQTMVLRSTGATTAPVVKFDYANAIWNPAMGIKSAAPRRVIQTTDDTYARITIMAADGQVDRISLCEDAQFSEEFDNGADATKLMSPNHINVYATIGENNYAAVASDDIEGTMLSMETMSGIDYTMSFDYVSGDALGVKDMRTGVVTAIKEGNTYTFVANENSVDANRFQIVRMPKVVTSVENAEDAVAPKGVYTIMGQYLGDTTMWESLPSGVYVVDGVKMVK